MVDTSINNKKIDKLMSVYFENGVLKKAEKDKTI